jgi:hypothetical protein
MKVIISRKGFDFKHGRMASPILPDGSLLFLPIPSNHDSETLGDLAYSGADMSQLIADLSRHRHTLATRVHLDPDLDRTEARQAPGWRPALGQSGAAQSHLFAKNVHAGDVFLFFGWFRLTELVDGQWRFVKRAPNLHVLFGWLEVDEILPIVKQREHSIKRHPWIVQHPHVANPAWYNSELNHLYIGREQSAYLPNNRPGGGRFPKFASALQLTKAGHSRSIWSLPSWFSPNGREPLSYHPDVRSWKDEEDSVTLRSACIGQEFVLDARVYPQAEEWVRNLIRTNA